MYWLDEYRNVVNPWQTLNDVRTQCRFLDSMFFKLINEEGLTLAQRREMLRLDSLDRSWKKPE